MQVTCVDLPVEQDWNPRVRVVELGLSLSLPMNLSHVVCVLISRRLVMRCYNPSIIATKEDWRHGC